MSRSLIKPVGTLFGAPQRSSDPGRIAVLGLPFDMGMHQTRIGSRSGPAHVRAQSRLVVDHLKDFGLADLLSRLGVVDWGDVDVIPGQVGQAFERIEAAVGEILEAGAIPLTMGGDGAVSMPVLRALRQARGESFAVVHFDAHTDAYRIFEPFHYSNANTFIHAIDEGIIDPARSVHIGMRDAAFPTTHGIIADTRDLGYDVIPMSEIEATGAEALGRSLRERFAGTPLYLCWDMDVFCPSVAPGVVTPSWGGLTVREGLSILRAMRGLDVIAFDINTVSPPHDPQGTTGALAAQIAMECLFLALTAPGAERSGADATGEI